MNRDTVGLVPISTLKKYREYNRNLPSEALGDSAENIDKLTESIKLHGITEPLQLTHKDGRGVLNEGNHRIIAAERAGLTHVPVVVWNRGYVPGHKGASLTWVGEQNRHGYMPSQAHPSNYKELQ
jgi:hypothetical protein